MDRRSFAPVRVPAIVLIATIAIVASPTVGGAGVPNCADPPGYGIPRIIHDHAGQGSITSALTGRYLDADPPDPANPGSVDSIDTSARPDTTTWKVRACGHEITLQNVDTGRFLADLGSGGVAGTAWASDRARWEVADEGYDRFSLTNAVTGGRLRAHWSGRVDTTTTGGPATFWRYHSDSS